MDEDILTFIAEELALLIVSRRQPNELLSYLDDEAPAYIHSYLARALASAGSEFAFVSEGDALLVEPVIDECRMIC